MTVQELKKKLESAPDDLQILIPVSHDFDGRFYSPCSKDSGETEMGVGYIDEEDEKEMELLNKKPEAERAFMLIPCGFTDEKDHTHELN
jgi:hypothetical protein